MRIFVTVCLLLFVVAGGQAQVKKIPPAKLKVTWEVIENHHQNKNQFLSALTITNRASRPLPSSGWNLYFNFVRSVVPGSVSGNVSIEHINGDLFRLFPGEGFTGIAPDQSLRITFISSDWVVNFTDAPSGLYLVWDDKPENGIAIEDYSIIPSTKPEQYLRFPGDKVGLVTPEMIYIENRATRDMDEKELVKVFPTPVAYREGPGLFMITESTSIEADPEFDGVVDYLIEELFWVTGKRLGRSTADDDERDRIILRKRDRGPEAYTLSVDPARIEIAAGDAAGAFYGIQSMKTLMAPAGLKSLQRYTAIPAVEVIDSPRFAHRAFFLDVARNFQSKQQLKKLIDLMSLYKLNVLHLHLNDDEGWRIEIEGLPELTEVGSVRGHTLTNTTHLQPSFGSGPDITNPHGSGFYSREDFIEILRYATTRFVRVIPEIETPGHARAAVKAMEARYHRLMESGMEEEANRYRLRHPDDHSVYRSVQGWNDNIMDAGLPSTYAFLEKVVSETLSMYKEAGAPIETIHFGGDEVPAGVWENSPACRAVIEKDPAVTETTDLWYYFFGKVNELVKSKGLYLYGWEEIALRKTKLDGRHHYIPNPDFIREGFQVDVWNNVLGWGAEDLAYRLANSGYKVVLSCVSHLYFDMAYHKSFHEPGYYWGAFVDVDKPFDFIPYDYFKNAKEDRLGGKLDRSIFAGKERLTEYGKTNIVGIQGLLWAENMLGPERMEYQMLPKFLGLAERAWAADPLWAVEEDTTKQKELHRESWSAFANVLGKRELPRLDFYHDGYAYRIPSPGATVENGMVHANIQLPGFVIRYTTDGKEPSEKSKAYQGPFQAKGIVKLKAFNLKGRGSRTSTVVVP